MLSKLSSVKKFDFKFISWELYDTIKEKKIQDSSEDTQKLIRMNHERFL